jgi:tetrapyrrole methylase family protein/MazG family protein
VVVVGLGPAGPDLLSDAARAALAGAAVRFVRTTRHPAAVIAELADATSFDGRYEQAEQLEQVYRGIVDALADAAEEHGRVAYAVPGSPLVAERTVDLLRQDERVVLEVVPALSFLDLAWTRLGVDPVAVGVRLLDGQRFATEAAGERGPLLVGQCDRPEVLSAIKLAVEDVAGDLPARPVTVLRRLGLPDEHVLEVPWEELDRSFEPDHLTTLWIPELAAPVAAELAAFAELVLTLRAECPWDREQTHVSLTRHLLEETYEVLEAIEVWERADAEAPPEGSEALDDAYALLQEELGDLLFQVYFHATIAAEAGRFTLADVAEGIRTKLVGRHPAIFPPEGTVIAEGDAPASAEEQTQRWEQIKKAEKGRASVMEGIPSALPALLLAYKVQRKARSSGFAYPNLEAAADDVRSELAEVLEDPSASEAGDLLFAATGVAVQLQHDPEAALRGAAGRFRDRFMVVERLAADAGAEIADVDPATLDEWWQQAKRETA